MDKETRKLLGDVVEALEAILLTAQVEAGSDGRKQADFAVREAVKRVNRLRRTLQGGGDAA